MLSSARMNLLQSTASVKDLVDDIEYQAVRQIKDKMYKG